MNTPTREQRKFHRRVQSAMARAYAPGREERMAKAQAKRDRKNAKRARDDFRSTLGHLIARERLEGKPGTDAMYVMTEAGVL
jgi:hypothetical protein